MARVTVEDCVDKISSGAPITVARDNDKNPVIALREIAEETVSIEELQKSLVMGLQKYVEVEEPEEEELEIMAAEKELADLDEQFSGLLLDGEMADGMQVHGGDDDDVLDLDAADAGSDDDISLDDEAGMDDGFDMGDDVADDFDEE